MNARRWLRNESPILLLVVVLAGFSPAHALQARPPSRFDAIAIPDPSVAVSPVAVSADGALSPAALRAGWQTFKTAKGEAWSVFVDARSGAPLLVAGQGIPFIPGTGNTLRSATPVTLESLEQSLRDFITQNKALLKADDAELVLNTEGSGQLTPDLWQVSFDRVVAGVPVVGDRYVFSVGHGNLISFGATRWSAVTASAKPAIPAGEAEAFLFNYMKLSMADGVDIHDPGTLVFLPMAAPGSAVDSYDGAVGAGYRTALAWRVALTVDSEPGLWVGVVDAQTGAVLALYDDIKYAQARGGIFPISDDGILPDGVEKPNYPMPWANITINSTTNYSSSMGMFTCSPAGSSATTTLQGQYVRVVDTCGSISKSVTCDADLNMGTSSGTDCTTPGNGGAGNTHSARSSFYHLNRIVEHARWWLPSNTWLQGQLTDNVNLNATCNAFWNGSSVNFYKSGGGCRNTGEIAGVFLHEWGHGLDSNDGGGTDNPGEAYADISSFLLTHSSCIGRGFRSSNCAGYGNACTNCTGVRDQDYAKHSTGVPQTADNWSQVPSCGTTGGPCGKEVHCEAYLAGETLWDLAARDLPASGIDQQTAWQIVDRLWFKSRQGSGGNAYGCGSPASSRSCAATAWMQKLLTIDDDNGNLADGTPHAAAIFAAFNRHNIQCLTAGDAQNQSTSSCPTLIAPTLTATGSLNAVSLSWAAVPNASSYNVLRNDQSCDWGHTVIANVTGTTYTDTNLPNNFPLYYSIQAVGSNSACTGTLATCVAAQAIGPCTNDPTFAGLATVTNQGASTCTLNLGWTAGTSNCGGSLTYNVYRSTTPGFTPSAGNRIATGLTGNSYIDAVGIASGTTYYYVVRAVDTSSGIEETNNTQQSGAPTGAFTGWTDTFEGAQSGGGFDQPGWTHNYISGTTNWAWSTAQKYDGTHSWFASEVTTTSDKVLVSPAFTVAAGTTLSFYHTYAFEGTTSSCYDAGTLEYTTNGGTTWTVVPDADFTAGGFTSTVYSGDTNPIKGKRAWCAGTIGAMTRVSVNLAGDPNLLNQTVQIRWHEGDDTGTKATGWYVDSVSVGTAASCTTGTGCAAPGAPTLVGATGNCAGVNLTWTTGTGSTSSYNVYRATTTGGPYTKLGGMPVTGSAYSDATAVTGTPYFYVIKGACDSGGVTESPYSNELPAARLTNGAACDDGNPCTTGDACSAGVCSGAAIPPPAEVDNTVQVARPSGIIAEITWSVPAGAASSDILRGLVSALPVGPGGGDETCLGSGASGTTLTDSSLPPAGDSFWYLIRGVGQCGKGSYGFAIPSSGPQVERVSTTCP